MDRLFTTGTYRGEGHWTDQRGEGRYTAQYRIADGLNQTKIHEVERIFLKPDGSVASEERTRVLFEPKGRNAVWVSIHGEQGTVAGPGYSFEEQCHYDIDVAEDNHLEFTFHAHDRRMHGLGSATNKGNRTYWEELLERI